LGVSCVKTVVREFDCCVCETSRHLAFCFSGSGRPRDLHSFPTRLSSDLPLDERQPVVETLADRAVGAQRLLIGPVDLGRRRLLRSEEHTSELQSLAYLVCRLLPEKKIR